MCRIARPFDYLSVQTCRQKDSELQETGDGAKVSGRFYSSWRLYVGFNIGSESGHQIKTTAAQKSHSKHAGLGTATAVSA